MEKPETEAVHLKDGDLNVVGLKALRVLLSQDGDCWFAQGLEVDYAAAGMTLAEAKKNFETGLSATIKEHLKMHGGIDNLLHVAPQSAWDEFQAAPAGAMKASFSMIDVHDLAPKNEKLDIFSKIVFVEPNRIAA